MKLKNDARLRKQLFVEGAMAHPAKGHIGLWQAIIEKYTQEGDWILDPMGGIGTSLVAALMGRNVICNEMEQHFIEPMAASWAKMQQHPMLGYGLGQVVILRGDATHLPLSSADAVITSPPYEHEVAQLPGNISGGPGGTRDNAHLSIEEARKSLNYTRPVDAVISSPPYANRLADTYVDDDPQRMSYEMGKAKIGAVVTSPPWEQASQNKTSAKERIDYGQNGSSYEAAYHHTAQNIGNQKGDAYWDSMRLVYQECHRVLKPGGVMALVLKGFTRDGKYIDLPQQTVEMVESLGFTKFDEWTRELWSLSFWRILQQRRDPAAFDERLKFEYVLAFRKDGDEGNGIEAVITSPPYEGNVQQHHDGLNQGADGEHFGGPNSMARRGGYTRKETP